MKRPKSAPVHTAAGAVISRFYGSSGHKRVLNELGCEYTSTIEQKKKQEDFIKMKNLRKSAVVLAAAALTALGSLNVCAAETVIKADSLAYETPEIVTFTADSEPVEINNTLYVPCRVMADAMGMTTEWDQESLTAKLIVKADKDSSKPIERYVYTICESGADTAGLSAVPSDMSLTLKADSSTAELRLGYTEASGERTELGKTAELGGAVKLMDGKTLMFPLRSVIESLYLELSWTQESRTASVSIPDIAVIPDGLAPVTEDTALITAEEPAASTAEQEQNMVYLGTFRISHYAPGSESNGMWGNATAWGGNITPGKTIAVDRNVIEPLSWVYIDGYGYRCAEDCGGAIKGNTIDVAVATYAEAMRLGVVYKDVYLCTD